MTQILTPAEAGYRPVSFDGKSKELTLRDLRTWLTSVWKEAATIELIEGEGIFIGYQGRIFQLSHHNLFGYALQFSAQAKSEAA